MGDAVTMTDKNVLTIYMIGGTMTGSFEFLLVAFEKQVAPAITHINTFAVEVWPVDSLAAPDSHAIVALGALTTIVP